jgi:endonuclease YncB( thermonuclease family)
MRAALLAVLLPPSGASSMRSIIGRRPALLRPLAALLGATTLPAHASTDVVVRVMDADRVKLERAGVVRLAGVRTPTRDVPVCYNREPGVKARAMLPRGTKVNVEDVNGDADVVAGGKSVSETLVREGFAYATPRRRRASDGEDYLASALAEAQEAAKRDQRGLWRPCGDASPSVPVATFDDIDFQPTPTKDYGDAPAKYKSCAEFEFYEDALAIFERAPESVRKRLDRDGDGVPCPGLPHTTDQERYRFKKRSS